MGTRVDGLRATSTSTVVVDAVGTRLRMFGVSPGIVEEAGFAPVPRVGVPSAVDPTYVTDWHGYVESDDGFEFFFEAWPLVTTAVPSHKEGQPLDDGVGGGARASSVEYQDPFVFELPNGLGWLMLLARYHNPDQRIGPGTQVSINATTSIASIVAFWSRDASFATGFERGPFQLVSRTHPESRVLSFGAPGPEVYWLGVPTAAVQVVDGLEWLYVYYVAEPTRFATAGGPGTWEVPTLVGAPTGASVSGIWARRIKVGDLALALVQSSLDGSWVDESSWDGAEVGLLPGEFLGKVRVWVPTGTVFTGSPTVDDRGNTEFVHHFPGLTLADPAAMVVEDGTLKLYFAAIAVSNVPPAGAGIWLACVVPGATGEAYGVDFVVRIGAGGPLPGAAVASWHLAAPAPDTYLLDPDPVKLPTGDWVVYFGVPHPAGGPPAFLPTDACVGPASAGEPDWEDAWR